MKSTKDVNGVDVKIFDRIAYAADGKLRIAEVTGIIARPDSWRFKYPGEVQIKVKYQSTESKWTVNTRITNAQFIILAKPEAEKAS